MQQGEVVLGEAATEGLVRQCEPLLNLMDTISDWKARDERKRKEYEQRIQIMRNDPQHIQETRTLLEQWNEGNRKKQDSHVKPMKPAASVSTLPAYPERPPIQSQSSPSFPSAESVTRKRTCGKLGEESSAEAPKAAKRGNTPPMRHIQHNPPQQQHMFYPAMRQDNFPPQDSFLNVFHNIPEINANSMQSFLMNANGLLPETDPSEVEDFLAATEGRKSESSASRQWPPPPVAQVASQQLKSLARNRAGRPCIQGNEAPPETLPPAYPQVSRVSPEAYNSARVNRMPSPLHNVGHPKEANGRFTSPPASLELPTVSAASAPGRNSSSPMLAQQELFRQQEQLRQQQQQMALARQQQFQQNGHRFPQELTLQQQHMLAMQQQQRNPGLQQYQQQIKFQNCPPRPFPQDLKPFGGQSMSVAQQQEQQQQLFAQQRRQMGGHNPLPPSINGFPQHHHHIYPQQQGGFPF